MGTALAMAFERAGNSVSICGTELDVEILEAIVRDRAHPILQLPVSPSIELVPPQDWAAPVGRALIVAVAVSTQGVRTIVRTASGFVDDGAIWAIASKGWDAEHAAPLSEVVTQESPGHPVVVVAGPSLAAELAIGTPTGLVCASADGAAASRVAESLTSASVRAFTTDDVAGVEVGAALKNVLAIAIGMCDGIAEVKGRPMTNTKAALFSRGLVETGQLAASLGGRTDTVLGLSGAGDLFVTVLGGRNGRFGRLVGTGLDPRRALEEMRTTVEGYENTATAIVLADRLGLDLPIIRMVHSVLYKAMPAEEGIDSVLLGAVEPEI